MARVAMVLAAAAAGCTLNDDHATTPRLYLGSVANLPASDGIELSWWLPSGDAKGFVLEQRIGSGEFVPVQTFDPRVQQTTVEIDADVFGDAAFRVREERTGTESSTVLVPRPLRLPAVSVTQGTSAFDVRFTRPPGSGDHVDLARRMLPGNGSAGSDWTTLAIGTARDNSYTDRDLAAYSDATIYEYRAVGHGGALSSEAVIARTAAPPYVAPVLRSLEKIGEVTFRLSFDWRSSAAATAEIVARRLPSTTIQPVARLPAPAAGPAAFEWIGPGNGVVEVAITASGPRAQGTTASGRFLTEHPPGSRLIDVPVAVEFARGPLGTAVLEDVTAANGSTARVLVPPGGTLADARQVPPWYQPPGIVLDHAGHPHVGYAVSVGGIGGPSVPIVHAWHDGLRWNEETVGTFDVFPVVVLAIGADDSPHLAWRTAAGDIGVAHRQDGIWTAEVLPPQDILPLDFSTGDEVLVAGDEAGSPHLIVKGLNEIRHLYRDAAGWHADTPPIGLDVRPNRLRVPLFLSAAAGRVTFGERVIPLGEDFPLPPAFASIATRGDAGWTAVGTAGRFPLGSCRGAVSPEGVRAAIAGDFGDLLLFDGTSITDDVWWFGRASVPAAVGFTPAGKAWVISYLGDDLSPNGIAAPPLNAIYFEEP